MIKSFRDRQAERLSADQSVPRFGRIEPVARRKLLLLDAAKSLTDLRSPPGNQLEVLKGDRKGQQSIRINDQWRLCFRWARGNAWEVEIVDEH